MRTVKKGWMRYDKGTKAIRVIVDDHGFIFGAGLGGWMRLPERAILKVLPISYPRDHWPHEGWWGANWRRPEWAWVYGR